MSTQKTETMLVKHVMLPLNSCPLIGETIIFKEALEEMGRTKLGIVCVVDSNNILLGVLTDGDIRRKLLKVQKPFSAFFIDDALDHAIRNPITVKFDVLLKDSITIMEDKQIWDLPVVNDKGALVGLLHLHPAIKALLGINK